MGPRICMNTKCRTDNTHEWKKGWPLRSGVSADLCYNCGSAYESFVFCNMFHLEEPGWRKCYFCNKRLHCGCRASISLLELLDFEGVGCRSCAMSFRFHLVKDEIPIGSLPLTINVADDTRTPIVENRMVDDRVVEGKLSPLCRIMEASESNFLAPSQKGDTNVSQGKDKWEEIMLPLAEVGTGFSSATQLSSGSSKFTKPDISRSMLDVGDMHESLSQPPLRMCLEIPAESSNFVLPFSNGAAGGREPCKAPPIFQQGQRSRPILPKPPKTGLTISSETNKSTAYQLRIARPPAEGRGKNHLLPRYWPRITDQELQQLSGDLNSTIVPLFEKVLSASDAGRIGRLVLPKACAEAYFPPISQSEGIPLRVQDVKGKEWVFQFRFWPNNNSRMYVLEGVTPCIQSMQLRAGDIITFSQIDPGGKLVMGFRKASNSGDMQDAQTSAVTNGTLGGSSLSGGAENLPTVSRCSGLFQTLKGSKDPHINALSEHLILAEGGIGRYKSENNEWKKNEDSPQKSLPSLQKKRTRNIGSKSKRLLMHSEEALELRVTWEEAQDLLRPPPAANPSIVTIEDHEFEEYDEPPVIGKRTVFTTRLSGEQEQWAQCDDCSKWRKLPMDVFLPPKWTCLDNVWDSVRCSCSAAEDMIQKDLENLLRVGRDTKKHKLVENHRLAQEDEPSGLDALATAAVLGDDAGDSGEPSSGGATTRHPRHRPGCTCIVCIQPPSGKGKHNPTCTCNVCMTVKRRFKTLMLRKKRRHSECEAAEVAQKSHNDQKGESEINGSMKHESVHTSPSNNEISQRKSQAVEAKTSSKQIDLDLNCHPNREEIQPEVTRVSIMTLDPAGCLPLENYMQQQNGLASLSSRIPQQDNNGDNERLVSEGGFLASVDQESNLE